MPETMRWFEQHDECAHMCIVCHGLRRDLVHEHVYARNHALVRAA
jgi:hypothetical protein